MALASGLVGAALIAYASLWRDIVNPATPTSVQNLWPPSLTWFRTSHLMVIAGVGLMTLGWWLLRPSGATSRRSVTWAAILWGLPFVLVPPIATVDPWYYAEFGRLSSLGADPYTTGAGTLAGSHIPRDGIWFGTTAPYPPFSLAVMSWVWAFSAGGAFTATMLMRVPAVLALGATAWAIPRVASRLGGRADVASWLYVANPFVLFVLIGGAHNDGWALGVVALALLVAVYNHWLGSAALLGVAALLKQNALMASPAVALAGMPGLSWSWRVPWRAIVRMAGVLAVALVVAAVGSTLTLGWGWTDGLAGSQAAYAGGPLWVIAELLGRVSTESAESYLTIIRLGVLLAGGTYALRAAPTRPLLATVGAGAAVLLAMPTARSWYWTIPLFLLVCGSQSARVQRLVMATVPGVLAWEWVVTLNMLAQPTTPQNYIAGLGAGVATGVACWLIAPLFLRAPQSFRGAQLRR